MLRYDNALMKSKRVPISGRSCQNAHLRNLTTKNAGLPQYPALNEMFVCEEGYKTVINRKKENVTIM